MELLLLLALLLLLDLLALRYGYDSRDRLRSRIAWLLER